MAAQTTASMLDALIRLKPEQWLLLAALTHEAPETKAPKPLSAVAAK